jgi:hypothetical protein
VSLPTPDAQSARTRSQQPHSTPASHAQPVTSPTPLYTPQPLASRTPPPAFLPAAGAPGKIAQKAVTNNTAHSWDWAPGGLKTLTAKRELPPRLVQRPSEKQPDTTAIPRNYTFALVILACIAVMLISGGIVFFLMLQP